ncbi:MAG TPA: Glu-tRNA(Gln) amidotransferase subunit GatE [Candidatus Kapabacteria bacterium]|nr:Glu-tRNA(Gln) amidotransferase subunit GatE [Candidatus Kapabacteria bacterium]HPO61915.1 Glu-tRNA(Gln) amidotransferase subunit GatE [Candidatus Kapabacteria bacterium]
MYEFNFKPFEEMTAEDYAKVGFKSGLEIHQQLLTEKKLFCRCPAGKYSSDYHAEILRHMRPTLSELGEYDGTALMEFKTKKDIIYRINRSTVCTYEMDDTPPFQINDQALDIAIEVGMLLNSSVVDEIHIARKQYLDGSIPTGFQRTAIVSVGGFIPFKDRNINIIQMSIEEDSCREFSDIGHQRIYLADRLGMPLIETVTEPEMRTPQEVAEVNDLLRRLARSTGKVRTGIGAGREDVNVSVTGGTRIEIKGVSKITTIPLLTYNEAMRQWNLLKLREELHRRGITEDTFSAKVDDVTKILRKTRYQPIYNAIYEGKLVYCVTLRNFKNLLRWQTQTDTYFSKEISDRVRVIACLTTLPNIIHSDYQGETISSAEGKALRKAIGATEDDTIVLVWGNKQDATTGAKEIIIRAKEATIGVPSETRQALHDGTNGFERILPGPQRMYPDTDLPPKKVTTEKLEQIRSNLPKQIWVREKEYKNLNLPQHYVKILAFSKYANVFERIIKELNIKPMLAATVIVDYPKKLKKKGFDISAIKEEYFYNILKAYSEKRIVRDAIIIALQRAIKNLEYNDVILPKKITEEQLKEMKNQIIDVTKQVEIKNEEKKRDIYLSKIMHTFRGTVEFDQVDKLLNQIEL